METLVGRMLNPKTNTLNVIKYRLSIYISKNGNYEQIPGRGQVRTGRGQVQDGQVEDGRIQDGQVEHGRIKDGQVEDR